MIRVVHVLTRTNIGGPSVMLVDLLDGLDGERFTQTVVRGAAVAEEGDYLADRVVRAEVVTIGGLRRSPGLVSELRSLFEMVRTLRRLKPDVVHTHMAKAGVIGRIAAVVARVPVRIHTFHGHLLRGYFPPPLTRVVVFVERVLRRVTSHALVVGEATRRDLVRAGIVTEERSTTIMPAARPLVARERTAARSTLGLPPDAVIVGFVGRLTGIKRPDRFLRLAASVPGATFVVFGNGPLHAEVRRDAANLPNVRLLDWNDDIGLVFGSLDVVVLTSDNEGVPVSLIEASSLAVPVVATDVGGVREIVEDSVTGFVVADDDGLASAVRRLVDDPELRRSMGGRGAVLIAQRCAMAGYLSTHAALYERLTGR
jgi:glycosyltransferase involved in cell wall biosynthesis